MTDLHHAGQADQVAGAHRLSRGPVVDIVTKVAQKPVKLPGLRVAIGSGWK